MTKHFGKLTSLFIVIFILAGYTLQQLWIPVVVRWGIEWQSCRVFGLPVRCEGVAVQGRRIVIDRPVMDGGSFGYRLAAQQVSIDYDFDLWNRYCDLDIRVMQPEVDVIKKSGRVPLVTVNHIPSLSWLTVSSRCSIVEGVLSLQDVGEQGTLMERVLFSGDASAQKGEYRGEIQMRFGHGRAGQDTATMKVRRDNSGSYAVMELVDLECSDVCKVGQFFNRSWAPVSFSDGVMRGGVAVDFDVYGNVSSVTGDVGLFHVVFGHGSMDLKGKIPEVHVKLRPGEGGWINTSGSIEFQQDAWAAFYADGRSFWEISNLTGSVTFASLAELSVAFAGKVLRNEEASVFNAEGKVAYDLNAGLMVNVSTQLKNETGHASKTHLTITPTDPGYLEVGLYLADVGVGEFKVIQAIAGSFSKTWRQLRFYGGRVNAQVQGVLDQGVLTDLRVEHFSGLDMEFDVPDSGLFAHAGEIRGNLGLDLTALDPMETAQADLTITQGTIRFSGDKEPFHCLSDVHADLIVCQGVVQKASLRSSLSGLHVSAELDWSALDEVMKLDLQGRSSEIHTLIPERFRRHLDPEVLREAVHFVVGVRRHGRGGLRMGGSLVVAGHERHDALEFGCLLEPRGGRMGNSGSLTSKMTDAEYATLVSLIPKTCVAVRPWISRELSSLGLEVKDGWFTCDHLPLDRYLAPFVFPRLEVGLHGEGSFRGFFDDLGLLVRYSTRDVVIEDSGFRIDIPCIGDGSSEDVRQSHPGVQYYDFLQWAHCGWVPVTHAVYSNKKTGNTFTDVSTTVYLHDKKAFAHNVNTTSDGITFKGHIKLDTRPDLTDACDVHVHIERAEGKVSQLRQFCSHFASDEICKLPIEGSAWSDNADLVFLSRQHGCEVQGQIHGSIRNGNHDILADMRFQDVALDYQYDIKDGALNVHGLHAQFICGKKDQSLVYTLSADTFAFKNIRQGAFDFDLCVKDIEGEVARCKGSTHNDGQGIVCQFDPSHTHLLGVPPEELSLRLKGWSAVDEACWRISIPIDRCVSKVQQLGKAMWGWEGFLGNLDTHVKGGQVAIEVSCDNRSSQNGAKGWTFVANAAPMSVDHHPISHAHIKGRKIGTSWTIEELRFGDFSAATDILHDNGRWKINFLGADYKNVGLLGMEGLFISESAILTADVNLLDVNIGKLESLLPEDSLLRRMNVQGHLRGCGKMTWALSGSSNGNHVDVSIEAKAKRLSIHGVPLQDTEGAVLRYEGRNGFVIENIRTALLHEDRTPAEPIELHIQSMRYQPVTSEMSLQNVSFALPMSRIDWFCDKVTQQYPSFSEQAKTLVQNLKDDGALDGAFSFSSGQDHYYGSLLLSDDTYSILGRDHYLRGLMMEWDRLGVRLRTQYRYRDHFYGIAAHSSKNDQGVMEGALVIADSPAATDAIVALALPPNQAHNKAVVIDWNWSQDAGLILKMIRGRMSGLDVNLAGMPVDPCLRQQRLEGCLYVDFGRAARLMPPNIAEKVMSSKLGDGYCLKGEWNIPQDNMADLSFIGGIEGRDFSVKGLTLESLQARFQYTPQTAVIDNLMILDAGGRIELPHVAFTKNREGNWKVAAPKVIASDLRPSALRVQGQSKPRMPRSLIINRIEVDGFAGTIGDESSFIGRGVLVFENHSKRTLQNPLLAIPSDIIARIGLDLDVLNPVEGNINFDVRNGRIWLLDFNDVYSEGRVSRFYLPSHRYHSSIDFDGNLNVKVRMKQHNLLFKIAELFTVSIQGHITKPTFSVQKQPQQVAEEKFDFEQPSENISVE